MLERLTVDDFAPHLGRPFATAGAAVELVSATPLRGAPAAGRAPFSLLFRGGAGQAAMPQGLHRLEHPSLGPLELFLVPIGPAGDAMQYEAIFN
ncbi:MAG: hypothetical protein KGN16_23615 [Burkholderiales bacterium]|nr:hypothetical protein [Burkholderiales bacterium]